MGELGQHEHGWNRFQPPAQGASQELGQERWGQQGENQCNDPDRAGVLGSPGWQGSVNGYEPNTASQRDCSWLYSGPEGPENRGKRDIGKILGQLRELQQSHLAYVQSHEERLRARLKAAEEYQAQIIQQMGKLESDILKLLDT